MAYFDKYGVEFSDDRKTLIKCPEDFQGEYIIPDGVRTIGNYAFRLCTNLIDVRIPSGVITIGDFAFNNCSNLKKIEIPYSTKKIGELAFADCNKLSSVIISNSVKNIGSGAFSRCGKINSIVLPNNISWIEYLTFDECTSLTNIYVPIGQKERFSKMWGLEEYADLIQETIIIDSTPFTHYIFFDTETTGIPCDYKAPISNSDNWPRLIQLAWILTDKDGNELKRKSAIIYPDGFSIPTDAVKVHGISTEQAKQDGLQLQEVLEEFMRDFTRAKEIVGHNIDFDIHIVGAELYRKGMPTQDIFTKSSICTMRSYPYICGILGEHINFNQKWPKLEELYYKVFGCGMENAHDALGDVIATKECFFELKNRFEAKASSVPANNKRADLSDLPF